MKPASYWISRAGDMYRSAAKMADIVKNDRLPITLRVRAEKRCRRLVELAADYEDLAFRTQIAAKGVS